MTIKVRKTVKKQVYKCALVFSTTGMHPMVHLLVNHQNQNKKNKKIKIKRTYVLSESFLLLRHSSFVSLYSLLFMKNYL